MRKLLYNGPDGVLKLDDAGTVVLRKGGPPVEVTDEQADILLGVPGQLVDDVTESETAAQGAEEQPHHRKARKTEEV